jgi:hypothetical protein
MSTTLLRPYTTRAEVQRETKNSGSELDDWYLQCINLASRYVEERCKRDFWFHDHSATAYVVDRRRVLEDVVVLPFPIITLTELRVFSDVSLPNDPNDVWDADEYYFVAGEPSIHAEAETDWKFAGASGRFGSYPFRGFLHIKGTFGYPLATEFEEGFDADTTPPPSVPFHVRRACTLIAAAISDEMHKEQVGLDGVRVELLETKIPREALMFLERYVERFVTQF